MDRIFNMDNKFFTFMGRVADLIILNLLFLLCCIPIVTIGPAITAMYYVTMKMVRNEEAYIARSFFKSFKENFKQGLGIWLIALVLIILEFMDFIIMKQLSGGIYTVVKYGLLVIALIMVMILQYVFPLLAKFVNTVKNTIPYTDASGTASPISNRLAPSFRLNTYDSGTLTRNDAVIPCSITGSDMP